MPVTKTAKRALRVTKRKTSRNKKQRGNLEAAVRVAQKSRKPGDVIKATSLADRAAKNNLIHKNRAARIQSALAKLLVK